MKAKQKQKNIPDGWSGLKLSDVCSVNQGLQIPISERFKVSGKDRLIYITNKYLAGGSEAEYIEDYSQSVVCKVSDVLMTRTGNTGMIVSGVSGVFHNNFFKITPKKDISTSKFIERFLSTPKTQYKILRMAGTSTIPDLNHGDFYSLEIGVPPLLEQNRIVSVLETWDSGIEKLKQKIAIKKQIKKGLMQELLTGKTRLMGFSGEWRKVKLGDIAKIYDGTHQTPKYTENGIPFYSVEHVTANQFSKTKFIARDVYEKESEKVKIEKGDILMTRIGDIGTARYIDWGVEASFYVTLALFKVFDKNIDSHFLSYLINSQEAQREIWSKTIHVAFPNKINLGDINRCLVGLPTELKEQKAIAAILTASDEEITTLEKKLALWQEQKKYLLNNLVIGQIRTPENLSELIPK